MRLLLSDKQPHVSMCLFFLFSSNNKIDTLSDNKAQCWIHGITRPPPSWQSNSHSTLQWSSRAFLQVTFEFTGSIWFNMEPQNEKLFWHSLLKGLKRAFDRFPAKRKKPMECFPNLMGLHELNCLFKWCSGIAIQMKKHHPMNRTYLFGKCNPQGKKEPDGASRPTRTESPLLCFERSPLFLKYPSEHGWLFPLWVYLKELVSHWLLWRTFVMEMFFHWQHNRDTLTFRP